ncbi:LacI family DNA-binding transcriptional regulator [Fictibacillus sp. Mic-4]|uniref:LacI family DNA-binding transcriptional regulator n=1 Tax=Fictibacillus sp. Mic-4 TaxID=3132826 RepID=UPI003CEEEDB9
MATIADVAKLTGLSRSTVSRVINHYPHVSEEKIRLVRDAMEQLNYYPNASAQKLRNQKTDTIAVLVPLLTNPFFAYLLEGIDSVATKYNLQLLVCQTKHDREKEWKFLSLLKTKQVDGVILTAIENEWDKLTEFIEDGPIVLCNEYEKNAHVPTVGLDQVYGGYIGTKHLIEKGHQHIAHCRGRMISELSSDREAGFRKALNEHGLAARKEWMFGDVSDIEGGKRAVREILAMKERPTAVFTGSDQAAAGMISEAKRHGLRIPEDLAVLGFDDQQIATITDPPLTTIKQPIEEIGQKAMELMIDIIIYKKDVKAPKIRLPFKLIERGST